MTLLWVSAAPPRPANKSNLSLLVDMDTRGELSQKNAQIVFACGAP